MRICCAAPWARRRSRRWRKQRERFIKGALEKGFPQKKVEKIFDLMEQFAGYGFNKSHSAAYAYLAFVTAYLKAHYPVDFMAALLTSETGQHREGGEVHQRMPRNGHRDPAARREPQRVELHAAIGEAHPLRPGRGEESGPVRRGGDRQGARRGRAHSRSLHQFCEKVDLGAVNRRMIESLIKAGAMDSLEGTRSQKLAAVEGAMEAGQRAWRDRESGQVGLFGEMLDGGESHATPLPNVPDWTDKEKLARRKGDARLLGHRPSAGSLHGQDCRTGHPRQLESRRPREECRGEAVRRAHRHHAQAQSRRQTVGAMRLEDRTGIGGGAGVRHQLRAAGGQVIEDTAVMVRGLVLPEENATPKISVQDIVALDNARIDLPSRDFDPRMDRARTAVRTAPRRWKSCSSASPGPRRSGCGWNRRAISRCCWMCPRRSARTGNSGRR